MASTATVGQTARQKARERRIALEARAKTRNDRIERWTAAVFTAAEERDRALALAAAAEDAMAQALMGVAGEGVPIAIVAELCDMTPAEIHKLIKRERRSQAHVPASTSLPERGEVAASAAGRPAATNGTFGSAPQSTASTPGARDD